MCLYKLLINYFIINVLKLHWFTAILSFTSHYDFSIYIFLWKYFDKINFWVFYFQFSELHRHFGV